MKTTVQSSQGYAHRLVPVVAMLCSLLGVSGASAQDESEDRGPVRRPIVKAVTFDSLHAADYELGVELHQARRQSLEGSEESHGIVEHLSVSPRGSIEPAFSLRFVGVEHRELSSAEQQRRARLFERHAGFLFRYGSFRVEDPQSAKDNYQLTKISDEPAPRAGRRVNRYVVSPKQPGPSRWILDLDRITGYPLYRAELDASGSIVSELEVLHFRLTSPAAYGLAEETTSAATRHQFSSLEEARQVFPAAPRLSLDSVDIPVGYQLSTVRIEQDPLSGDLSSIRALGDGIDDLFVISVAGASRPIPIISYSEETEASRVPHMLLEIREGEVQQFHFWHADVLHQVIGKANQPYLRKLATDLYREALRSR